MFLSGLTGVDLYASRATIQANIGNAGYRFKKSITDPFTGSTIDVTFALDNNISEEAISLDGKYLYTTRTMPASETMDTVPGVKHRGMFIVDAATLVVTHYVNDSKIGEVFTLITNDPIPTLTTNVYVMSKNSGQKFVNTDPLAATALWMAFDTFELEAASTAADLDILIGQSLQDDEILKAQQSLPTGAIIMMPSSVAVAGAVRCDGPVLSKAAYPALYAKIGDVYELPLSPTSATDFRGPDFRGVFLRGLDNGRGLDPSRALGLLQTDAIRNITGQLDMFEIYSTFATGAFNSTVTSITGKNTLQGGYGYGASFDASLVVPTAAENRPVNHAVEFWIKY